MKDVLLMVLAHLAEEEPTAEGKAFEPDVTLLVGGILVSGFVVSKKKYMEHHPIVARIQKVCDEHKDEMPKADDEQSEDLSPDFIHLRDARCFTPSGGPVPTNQGVFWRISLESVQGFHFGLLGVPPVEK
jgi:hypothetical protein